MGSVILNSLVTLCATFFGALFAFRLQRRQKREDEKSNHVAAGNRALSILMQQANTLKLFQNDFIDPNRENPGRHIKMLPTLLFQEESLLFDFKSLDFLAQPKYHQTLFDLSIEESRYREAIKAINARSKLHLEEVQPRLMAAGFQDGQEYTGEQFLQAVGELHYMHLKRLTDAVVIHVDRTAKTLFAMKDRLRKTLVEYHPDGKFIDFELVKNLPEKLG